MELTIKSRKLGKDVTFSRPGSYYIYVDLNDQPGSLGLQICEAGCMMGHTLSYEGDDDAVFARICRRWYRAYIRGLDDLGLPL